MKTLLEVKNLQISFRTDYGKLQAVRDIDFEVQEGKTTAIVGESGCGKSVTAKAIMGLVERPGVVEAGSEMLYQGTDLAKNGEREWNAFRGKECSMIFQDALTALNPTMTIEKQVVENLENHVKGLSWEEKKKRVEEILALTGIPDAEYCMKKYPHELSGGMRQRVMIAMALITHPRLLIADEPTTALDVTIQAQILELIEELQEQMNMSVILITHDLGIVADIADEVLVMYAGRIVERGITEDIFYHFRHPYTWLLLNSVPKLEQDRQKDLLTIEGGLPDMIQFHEGCAFYNRCPFAMNVCRKYQPGISQVSETHKVECWLMDEQADVSGIPFLKEERIHE